MSANEYAPIAVFVYRRLDCTKKMLQALQEDPLAKYSVVYIFSDGYKSDTDRQAVEQVQKYLGEYEKRAIFKEMHLIYHKNNIGLANSIISGVTQVINEYGKVIVLEDDLIVQGNFLQYMNDGLMYYQNDSRIWSISGFAPEMNVLKNYKDDTFLSYTGSSWGWGTWKNRWCTIDWSMTDYHKYKINLFKIRKFCRGGNYLPSLLRAQIHGKIDSWAIRWNYSQSMQDKLSVFPKQSRVRNVGFRKDATHTLQDDANKNHVEMLKNDCTCRFEHIELDRAVIKEWYHLHKLTLAVRVRDKVVELKKKYQRGR